MSSAHQGAREEEDMERVNNRSVTIVERQYGDVQLECVVEHGCREGAYCPGVKENVCRLSEAQDIFGVLFPKGSVAFFDQEKVRIELPAGTRDFEIGGVKVSLLHSVSFYLTGVLRSLYFTQSEHKIFEDRRCCLEGGGCSVWFDQEGAFDECGLVEDD